MSLIPALLHGVLLVACLLAAWFDLRQRRIPNWLCGVVALVGLGAAVLEQGWTGLGGHATHLAVALVVGALLFRLGVIGGGDAKFYAAVAAWFGLDRAWLLLVAVTLSGAVLAVIWFTARRLAGKPMLSRPGSSSFDSVPYGIAIAVGAAGLAWA